MRSLNKLAAIRFQQAQSNAESLRLVAHPTAEARATVLDFGVHTRGSLAAGIALAKLCMADLAEVRIVGRPEGAVGTASVEVMTDQPVAACLGAQYAGWPFKSGKYFAMASGPMRLKRGREELLSKLQLSDPDADVAVGVLESDALPSDSALAAMIEECNIPAQRLLLAVAPTQSIAGTLQVVARSVETAMHKLDELKFDVQSVLSGFGSAPLPPPAKDTMGAIGRTNDAILYGGRVTLWVDAPAEEIQRIGPLVPSLASRDFGRPFAHIFADYGYDFYKIDPLLFSPAEITFINLREGTTQTFGQTHPQILTQSFS